MIDLEDGSLHRYILSIEPLKAVIQDQEFNYSLPDHHDLIVILQQTGKLPIEGEVYTGYFIYDSGLKAVGPRTTINLADLTCLQYTPDYPRDELTLQLNQAISVGGINKI